MEIKVRTKEQQAIDNLKAIVYSKGKKIEIEPPVEDTAQILLDYITNLEECCKDKTDTYQVMIIEYSKLHEKYKKSCETYQEVTDEIISEKMDLEDKIKKAIEYIKNKQKLNKMFGTITLSKDSQNKLLNILGGDDNE